MDLMERFTKRIGIPVLAAAVIITAVNYLTNLADEDTTKDSTGSLPPDSQQQAHFGHQGLDGSIRQQRLTRVNLQSIFKWLGVDDHEPPPEPEDLKPISIGEEDLKPISIGDENAILWHQLQAGEALQQYCYSLHDDTETAECMAESEAEFPNEMATLSTQEQIDFNQFVSCASNDVNMDPYWMETQLWRVAKAFGGEIVGEGPKAEDKAKLFGILEDAGITQLQFRDAMIKLANKYAGKRGLIGPGGTDGWLHLFKAAGLNIISEEICDNDVCLKWAWN